MKKKEQSKYDRNKLFQEKNRVRKQKKGKGFSPQTVYRL